MSETPAPTTTPQSNSPFAAPVPPSRVDADASTAAANSKVVEICPNLAEARRVADQTPQQRYAETTRRDGERGEQLGARKLSDVEYASLTYPEKIDYAEARSKLADGNSDPSKTADPSKLAETKIKIGENFEVTEAEARGLMERAALEELRKLTRPAEPTGYKLALPSDFVQPPGIEFKFDETDPAVQLAREFAHKNDFSQPQFERMAAIYAAMKVQEITTLKAARDAEVAKLGATAVQRITAAETFLRGHLGDDLGKTMSNMLVTAKHVVGFERLMQKFANSGSGAFSPPRSPSEAPKISQQEYDGMSYSQKIEYARQASANSGGRRG